MNLNEEQKAYVIVEVNKILDMKEMKMEKSVLSFQQLADKVGTTRQAIYKYHKAEMLKRNGKSST